MKKEKLEKSLEVSVNPSRREFVVNTVKASAFAVPLALGMETLTARKVYAQENSSEGGGTEESSTSSSAASVPEPAAVTLLGLGLASLAIQARRRQKMKATREDLS